MSTRTQRPPALALALALAGALPCMARGASADSAAARIARAGNGRGAPPCAACHGAGGQGVPATATPRLAGLPAVYQQQQLQAFADGRRVSAIMQPIARALSASEIGALAGYYARASHAAATLPLPASTGSDLGARLATRGRWSDDLPGCVQCHGTQGSGVGTAFPPLAGQPAAYLRAQLLGWQRGERPPGPLGLMEAVARKLSARDIRAVAGYFGSTIGSSSAAAAAAPTAAAPVAAAPGGTQGPPAAPPLAATTGAARFFQPPPESSLPSGPFGQAVRFGEQVFTDPERSARAYVGNSLRCSSCHLDAGRRPESAPLWAAYVAYPAYRTKNGHVNTFAERLQGCFRYSMNGRAPPLGSEVLVGLEAYAYWLASGARVDAHLPGRGYPQLAPPPQPADAARGRSLYAAHCALCHGTDGAGQSDAEGQMAFPALWGAQSYNWGAGMANINQAADFIAANMPFSQDHTLSDQQAWDLARYIDSRERPQDPRFEGSVAATRARFHDTPNSMYGRRVDGHVLGSEPGIAAGGQGVR